MEHNPHLGSGEIQHLADVESREIRERTDCLIDGNGQPDQVAKATHVLGFFRHLGQAVTISAKSWIRRERREAIQARLTWFGGRSATGTQVTSARV